MESSDGIPELFSSLSVSLRLRKKEPMMADQVHCGYTDMGLDALNSPVG